MACLDQPPPGYTPMSSGPSPHLQFDIVPRSDATSFQAGYLGLQHHGFQAWVKGEVLLKLDGDDSQPQQPLGPWQRCTITLTATESAGDQSILLFTSSHELWTAPSEAPSSSTAPAPTPSPPAVMPFSFELTPDLPHCIHLPTSSLVYELHARLHAASPSAPDTTRSVPVHLTRYTSPGKLAPPAAVASSSSTTGPVSSPGPSASASSSASPSDLQRSFSAQPHVWHLHHPVPIAIRLRKSILRRAEPIELHFRIPPPPALLEDAPRGGSRTYAEKGLRLRSVEADLVRVVRVKAGQAGGKDRDVGGAQPSLAPQELLLAHSGKLARFHSKRAIQLRLTLHPPFDRSNMPFPHPDHDAALSGPVYGRGGGGGCESISQETLLHDIRFEVRARVGLSGDRGESRDVRVSREVWIAPGAIGQGSGGSAAGEGASGSSSDAGPAEKGQGSKSRQAIDEAEEPIDQRAEDGFEGFRSEDEYDGYEDVGRSLLDEGDEGGEGGAWRNEEQEALALQAALWPEDAVLDAVSHAEATASYERLTRANHSRPAYSSEDPATQQGPPSPSADAATDGSASLERTPSHHRQRLEQLRVLLEQRERQIYRGAGPPGAPPGIAVSRGAASNGDTPDDPPPSLLESQHDLQVEVEVEGVGSAMPRSLAAPSGLDAEAFHQLSLGAPPHGAEDDGELPPFGSADLRGYSAREARGGPAAGGSDDDDHLPPPPISPGHHATHAPAPAHAHGQGQDDAFPPPPPLSPPPPGLASSQDTSSAGSTAGGAEGHHGSGTGSLPRTLQPPPYIAGAVSRHGGSSLADVSSPSSALARGSAALSVPPPLPARPSSELAGRGGQSHGSVGGRSRAGSLHAQDSDSAPPPAYPPAYAQASASASPPRASGRAPPALPPRPGGAHPRSASGGREREADGLHSPLAGPPRYEA